MMMVISWGWMIIFAVLFAFAFSLLGFYIGIRYCEKHEKDIIFGDVIIDLTDAEKDVIQFDYAKSLSEMMSTDVIAFNVRIRE